MPEDLQNLQEETVTPPIKQKWYLRASTWVLVGIFAVLAVLTIASVINRMPYKSITLPDVPVTMQRIDDTAYYYDQLTDQEKSIYHTLLKQLNDFQPQVVVLDRPITEQSRLRIQHLLLMSDYKMLDFFALGQGNKNFEMTWKDESSGTAAGSDTTADESDGTDKDVYMLFPITAASYSALTRLVQSEPSGAFDMEQMNTFLKNCADSTYRATYEKMYAYMNHAIDNLVAQLPRNNTHAEAIRFFYDWEAQNIRYDPDVYRTLGLSLDDKVQKYKQDSALMHKIALDETPYAIVDKETVCGGFSTLLNKLLNRAGVHSYLCVGTMNDGENHAWNRVEVGGVSAYIDLTNVASKQLGLLPKDANFYCISAKDMQKLVQFSTEFQYIPVAQSTK